MLETRNLSKIYKPKKGVPVTALNKVSLIFPEKGMVFLLGKSGSGKSTLLNLLGGLDKYNEGEIIIKGVSSKDFKQKHFDSYRNTYLGFIFQEYNILDEFTVGANIALALELQGKKATDEEINRILGEVDLAGYGSRKPNELSGGQKQRVAIARALVKNPEIIMADEPTGALDSVTGAQVLSTLKKLSKQKLIIVVSHDREFAEQYADRIIELADGCVISDVEIDNSNDAENAGLVFDNETITVPKDYRLTEQDRIDINEYIKGLSDGAVLKVGNRSGKRFVNTDTAKIKKQSSEGFHLIKSRLPIKNAFKIGANGLKYKKFRLVVTVFLSCIAFGLFGLSDTFGAYNHVKTCTNSLYDSNIDYVAVNKSVKIKTEDKQEYWRDWGYSVSDSDLTKFCENTGVKMHGVYSPINGDLNFSYNVDTEIELTKSDFHIYRQYFNGFIEVNDDLLEEFGYELVAGKIPDGNLNELAISRYVFEVFKKSSYTDGSTYTAKDGSKHLVYQGINEYGDILNKKIKLNGNEYTVVGIVDTKISLSRYESLIEEKSYQSNSEQLIDHILYQEFCSMCDSSLACAAMVGEGGIEKVKSQMPNIYDITNGYLWFYSDNMSVDPNYLTTLSEYNSDDIVWLDGKRASLSDKEIIVTEQSAPVYDVTDYATALKNITALDLVGYSYGTGEQINENGYKIVGYIPSNEKTEILSSAVIVSDRVFNMFSSKDSGDYSFAVGSMPKEKKDIGTLVAHCYNEEKGVKYPIQSAVTYELDSLNEVFKELAKVFLYIGIGFALFAAIMLANFIGTSISYKKQEIGILRAIGSRSSDVFRIFFAESFIIAMINFVLSTALCVAAAIFINYYIRNNLGILITVLGFGIRQILLLFVVSVFVAFAASYLPVKRIASKTPIDAIREK